LPQHLNFVQTIKTNRAKNNLDRICCNKGKLTYECVWAQADNDGPWLCIFALDIYDWKDLGRTRVQPARDVLVVMSWHVAMRQLRQRGR